VVASAAMAIAISAAAVVACGGTTSRVTRLWDALVTPIVWASHMMEPAHADAATVYGYAAGSGIPGVQVERHPGDRPN
jgi:hypothetical protein